MRESRFIARVTNWGSTNDVDVDDDDDDDDKLRGRGRQLGNKKANCFF